jgi:hypothetical protein
VELESARDAGESEREFALRSATPRSTLRHWDRRREAIDLAPALVRAFESPEGVAFLHRMVVSLVFVMTLRSPDGVRLVSEFLELSGLADLVASSVGTAHKMATRMQEEIIAFGGEQRTALAGQMTQKTVTVCQDETFHPEICLVAIEPVSNFILLEEYAEHRDAPTWTKAMDRALKGLAVKVIQSTSDEAKALKAQAAEAGAHHSPDVFHAQRAASSVMSRPLAVRVERAKERLENAVLATEQGKADRGAYESVPHGPGRPPGFAARIEAAEAAEAEARTAFEAAEADRQRAREAIRGLSASYHPYRLADGAHESPEGVEKKLDAQFEALEAIADNASLGDRSHAGINKARRVAGGMVKTIRFVHEETNTRLTALGLPDELRADVEKHLVPGLYLERVVTRAATAEERLRLTTTADALLSPLRATDAAYAALPVSRRDQIQQVALGCADLFQRSSSCVEGRNGQLSLWHHGQHQLSPRKLKALTTVHNYFVHRDDGTTAAERFFGAPPDDLFERLVQRMPLPARPAARRPRHHPRPLSDQRVAA